MANLSILQNLKSSDIKLSPFPYVVIDKVLPEKLYNQLSKAYPSVEVIFNNAFRKKDTVMQQNQRYDLSAAEVYNGKDIELGPWRDFVYYHTSQEFYDEFMDKFSEAIHSIYPDLQSRLQDKAPNGSPRAGIRRHGDKPYQCEMALDCQIGMNSPATKSGTSVKGPHLDNPIELFASLFYLKHEKDKAKGGDLVLYHWNEGEKPAFYEKRFIKPELITAFATVPYGPNRYAILFNTLQAVHGVTAREKSIYPRRLCNIIMETYPTTPSLFEVKPYQKYRSFLGSIFKKFK
jgi:hypothetical protein